MSCIALVYGLPGVGKTTVCREIEAQTRADYCCVDELWATLLRNPTYSATESSQVFQELLRRLELKMSAGANLILAEGVFASASRVHEVRDTAANTGYRLRCYLLTCNRESTLERLSERESDSPSAQKQMHELWHFLSEKMNSKCEADLQIATDMLSPSEAASRVCRDLVKYLQC